MSSFGRIIAFLFIFLPFLPDAGAEERKILFREEFQSLENWKPFYLPKKKHTVYTIEQEGDNHYLRAESNASASALTYKEKFNVYDYPGIRWRWKAENTYLKGDPLMKDGDDYPVRVYVVFDYDSENAGFFKRARNSLIKKIYGQYPPHSSLTYAWSSREIAEDIVTSPYAKRVKIILIEKGSKNVGRWKDEDINIIDDYRKAFGESPPPVASLAIMNDSDNTGEKSVSFIDYIEVYR
jgi:hypothetical protein